jgi:hypothetical protein
LDVNNDQHFYQWLVIRNARGQRENIVVVEKPLFPRKELKAAGEVERKGMSRISPRDVSVTVWAEPFTKARMVLCIATVNLSPESPTELMFLPPM